MGCLTIAGVSVLLSLAPLATQTTKPTTSPATKPTTRPAMVIVFIDGSTMGKEADRARAAATAEVIIRRLTTERYRVVAPADEKSHDGKSVRPAMRILTDSTTNRARLVSPAEATVPTPPPATHSEHLLPYVFREPRAVCWYIGGSWQASGRAPPIGRRPFDLNRNEWLSAALSARAPINTTLAFCGDTPDERQPLWQLSQLSGGKCYDRDGTLVTAPPDPDAWAALMAQRQPATAPTNAPAAPARPEPALIPEH